MTFCCSKGFFFCSVLAARVNKRITVVFPFFFGSHFVVSFPLWYISSIFVSIHFLCTVFFFLPLSPLSSFFCEAKNCLLQTKGLSSFTFRCLSGSGHHLVSFLFLLLLRFFKPRLTWRFSSCFSNSWQFPSWTHFEMFTDFSSVYLHKSFKFCFFSFGVFY